MARHRGPGGTPTPTRRQPFLSVGTKLTAAMLVVLGILTSFTYIEASENDREQLRSAKERSSMMVSELFAAGIAAPLAFGDEPGIREQLGLLMSTNTGIVYGAVWSSNQKHAEQRGEKLGEVDRTGEVHPPSPVAPTEVRIEQTDHILLVERPVTSVSGERLGVVRVGFSLREENAAIEAAKRRTLLTSSGMGIGLTLALLGVTRTIIIRRLARLASAAKRLEDGEPAEIDVDTNDEVGALSRALVSMTDTIAAREARIVARNRDLRHILDNVTEGLMTVKKDGTMSDERSRILDAWFGAPAAPGKFFEYFESFSPATARWLRIGWTALADDCMPIEVILDQMPRRFEHRRRFFQLGYLPILAEGSTDDDPVLEEVLIVVSDVTSAEERERAEQQQRDTMNIVRRILEDRAGFREFFHQCSRLVDTLDPAPARAVRVMRDVHTLKGNTSLYGIDAVSAICHRIESRVQEEGGTIRTDEIEQLRRSWDSVRTLARELQIASSNRIELSSAEYAEHLHLLASFASHRELLEGARGWGSELATRRMQRVAEQAMTIARRLGKASTSIDCRATSPHLRLPPEPWELFWSVFSHVLKNTFDHGIEPPAERLAAGKPASGRVQILLARTEEGVELTVSDDGRGISWDVIRERAAKLGLPHESQEELEDALYADRLTTKDLATTTSGRGIGMAAVRECMNRCGGRITLESSRGVGTTFRFHFPEEMLDHRGDDVTQVQRRIDPLPRRGTLSWAAGVRS